MDGISSRHGAHHVAHRFSRTTLPRSADSRTVWPARSGTTKSGASGRAPHGATRRCRPARRRRAPPTTPATFRPRRSAIVAAPPGRAIPSRTSARLVSCACVRPKADHGIDADELDHEARRPASTRYQEKIVPSGCRPRGACARGRRRSRSTRSTRRSASDGRTRPAACPSRPPRADSACPTAASSRCPSRRRRRADSRCARSPARARSRARQQSAPRSHGNAVATEEQRHRDRAADEAAVEDEAAARSG